jgi:tRNA threonylcarbamoyladenosine biosynthesis protein TsaB
MRALSIDTSSPRAGVALWSDGDVVAYQQNDEPKLHGERLLTMIERACAEAGWARSQIDLIACGLGPGSFAGVRIGVATAKGIALALHRPIQGVASLAAMADAALRDEPTLVLALLDARRGEVFWALYDHAGGAVVGPAHASVEALPTALATQAGAPIIAVGEVASSMALPGVRVFRSVESDLPHARHVARCAVARYARGEHDDVHALEPVYVRPPDITLPRL